MRLLSKFDKGFRFLLCVIDIFSKYARVIPLKDKKGISIVNGFQKIKNDSRGKPNKILVDKGSEFYNNSFKKWLRDNDIVMYSTNNEGKSVVAERFITTLKNRIYKYMTAISKNVYIDNYWLMNYENLFKIIVYGPVILFYNCCFEKRIKNCFSIVSSVSKEIFYESLI